MTAAEKAKIAVAVGIVALVSFTMIWGQGWWWRQSMRTRVISALAATAVIVGVGFWVKLG